MKFDEWILTIAIFLVLLFLYFCGPTAEAQGLTASWYSRESCRNEGTPGIMANGKELKDEGFSCASWDHKFGTRLKITNLRNNKTVLVEVTDRGPAKRLYKQGRVIDLSRAAFSRIADIKQGIVPITMEVVR